MSTDVVRIEPVYEPGFGETGRQKLEDLVMFESPVGLVQLDIKERLGITKRIQEIAKKNNMRSSFQPMAMDLITFAEKGEASLMFTSKGCHRICVNYPILW